MPAYPLPTLGCTIDEFGISAPAFADILGSMKFSYLAIYGQDADLDDDTQDGQWIGIQAKAQNDQNNACIAAFNARNPATAQGVGLSGIVKINGLAREGSSNSTADVLIVGVTGTNIANGLIGDNVGLGTQWALPAFILIGDSGEIVVTATCTTAGNITAEANTLTQIITPTIGWQTVNNSASAFPGSPVEEDATLRQRQAVSQNQAADSPASACLAAILNLPGVARGTYDENVGTGTDANGVPGKSICYIIGGGDVIEIATTIAQKKSTGCGTYGSTSEVIIDPKAVPVTINFDVLALTTVAVVIHINALTGYSSTTADLIKAAVSAYISALPIGAIVYLNKVEAVAALMASPLNATFEIIEGSTTLNAVAANYVIDFNKAAVSLITDVSVVVGP
jgi:uncharacterized phage protein gp47/JayE